MANEIGNSRPVDLTDAQVKDLASAKGISFGEQSRPRAVTAKDVEALRAGKAVNLEKIAVLGPVAEYSAASKTMESRPRTLTETDVEGLRQGKDIGLEKREPLKSQ